MIYLLLALLFTKHFLFDYPLQNQVMIDGKGEYLNPYGLYHSFLHAIGTMTVFTICGGTVWLVLLVAGLDFLIHYHIDFVKANVSRWLTTKDKWFWNYFGLDQLAHALTYIGLVALAVNL